MREGGEYTGRGGFSPVDRIPSGRAPPGGAISCVHAVFFFGSLILN